MSIIIGNIEYKIIKELGRGGYGKVLQVLSHSDNKCYAIKEIPIKGEQNENIINFKNEAYILSQFNCNNIVKYYNLSMDNNNIYILMEFCKGENLRSFIDKNMNAQTLIEENILKNIIRQICRGIEEIHNKNIIHRNLKPENIFMNENMDIKIGDFGLSKQMNLYKTYAITINKAGSDFYIAPEIKYKGIYNDKSDIWSLGCILYELFTLNIYAKDKLFDELKKINSDIYNYKWQELINSLLIADYTKRFNINQVNNFLKDKLNIFIYSNKEINQIGNLQNMDNDSRKANKYLQKKKENQIIGEIYINENEINKDIQIINSFENVKRISKYKNNINDYAYKNEKEIKDNIEIKIDEKIIKFTYYYKFNTKGKYKIIYSFKNNLSKTCYLFYDCNSLTNLNLSNFNTTNVIDMSHMFEGCNSLTNLNLSNFNTTNVNNMTCMFGFCTSLTNLNLSNFNTTNVNNMNAMFKGCKSLKNLNLSNFNIANVNDMSYMFEGCILLKKENIITKDNKILGFFN